MKRCYMWRAAGALLLAGLMLASCASSREASRPALFGTWNYSMSNPAQGDLSGTLSILEAEDGTYTGHITVAEMGLDEPMTINGVEIEGDNFTVNGHTAGYDFTMTGVVEGDTITGENDVAGVGIYSLRATRAEE